MKTGLLVNFNDLASRLIEDHIQGCQRDQLRIDAEKLRNLKPQLVERLQDFVCVLKFRKTKRELLAMGDAGIFKLAQVFGVSVTVFDGPVQQRCQTALLNGDRSFLNKIDSSLKLQREVDRRIKDDKLFVKHFLYLNWDIPFFIDTPLRFWTNRQIADCLEKFFLKKSGHKAPDVWDEQRIKKELSTLGLRRSPSTKQPS